MDNFNVFGKNRNPKEFLFENFDFCSPLHFRKPEHGSVLSDKGGARCQRNRFTQNMNGGILISSRDCSL